MRKTNRPLTTTGLALSVFLSAMEMTVVSTAMPSVVGELGGLKLYAWVFTAFMLTSTVTVPIYGKLADLYGRKPVLQLGTLVFVIGSVLCAQSGSMVALILSRALQGLGAGAMGPIGLTVIGDIFDFEERGRMQGLFSALWGLAGLAGPLAGGYLVHYLSWHWVFYVNVPFGAGALVLIQLFYFEHVEKRDHRLDWLGAAVLTLAIAALLAAADRQVGAIAGYGAAALLGLLFLAVEARAREPVVPLGLFRQRVIAIASGLGALLGAAMYATVTYVPLYVQAVLGGDPTSAGRAVTFMVVGWPIGSFVGGRLLASYGYRAFIRGGLLVSALSALALALLLGPMPGVHLFMATTFGFGLGLGFANTALLIAVQTTVPWNLRGVATASTMFFRTIGATIAIGALGGALTASLDRVPGLPASAASALLGPEHGRALAPALLARLSAALKLGLGAVFWTIAAIALASFALGLLFPRLRTPQKGEAPAGEGAF